MKVMWKHFATSEEKAWMSLFSPLKTGNLLGGGDTLESMFKILKNCCFSLLTNIKFSLNWFKKKASSKGASASVTTHRFSHLQTDLPTRIGHGTNPCPYYLRPIAASDLGQFQQSHWGDVVDKPLGWSRGAIELIYCPKRHWPALASPRLHLFSTAHVNSRRHIITALKTAGNAHTQNLPVLYPPILDLSGIGKSLANFWQILASEGGRSGFSAGCERESS